ncbi:MAG: hypothetical protein GY941_28755, partial [Planctomycetes bacterium]|nr:hypothetical protein [Planctomycetota bacterium]
AKALGLPAQAYRAKTQFAADFVPGLGDYLGAEDAKLDYDKGNYGSAALGGVLTAAGALLPMAKPVTKAAAKGIRAFHGSPHSFDKFSMDKIGTGEGAQAYGHGLYFAENEGVAREYRDALRGNVDALEKSFIDKGLSKDEAQLLAKYRFKGRSFDETFGFVNRPAPVIDGNTSIQDYRDALKKRMPQLREAWDNTKLDDLGSMYEVNIDANPDDFLDWDKPLSEQGKNVQNNIKGFIGRDDVSKHFPDMNEKLRNTLWDDPSGNSIYRVGPLGEGSADKSVIERTNILKDAGIPGIKYKDAGSRSNYTVNTFYKGEPYSNPLSFPTLDNAKKWAADQESKGFTTAIDEGTSNFVVFDENLISIVKKYGVAGAVSMGLVSQADGEAIAAQIEGEQPDSLGSILAEALK